MSYNELNMLIELVGNKRVNELKPSEIKKAIELAKVVGENEL